MTTTREQGLAKMHLLADILPIFVTAVSEDAEYIFGSNQDPTILSICLVNDLLDSDAPSVVANRAKIIELASLVGDNSTMSRALYLLEREQSAQIKQLIAQSLMQYRPIDEMWVIFVKSAIDIAIINYPELTDVLREASLHIQQTAFSTGI